MFKKVSPNYLRFFYDLLSLSFANLFISFILAFFYPVNYKFLLSSPFIAIMFCYFYGVYGRNRFSSVIKKVGIILLSLLSTGVLSYVILNPKPSLEIALFLFVGALNLSLPRIFIYLANISNGFIRSVVNFNGPVVVTGGAGYIGSHVVAQLLDRGYSVRVLDSLMYGSDSIQQFLENPKFELIQGDVTDIVSLTSALSNASSVIHLAGLVGDPACAVDARYTKHTNIIATKLIKQVAHSMGVHRFIFSSSCSVYGVSDTEVSEVDGLNPVSLYAQTKIDSENELLAHVPDDFIVTILRFATVFGDSRRPRFDLVANLFSIQAMTDGSITVIGPNQWRPFIHVEDLARAVIYTLEADPKKISGQIFNVGDANLNMTLKQLADIVKRCANQMNRDVKINIVEGNISDLRNYAVSFWKIKNTLGFVASRTMEDGLAEIMSRAISGYYKNYKEPIYSNLLTTKEYSEKFRDPMQRSNLYASLDFQ